MLRTPNLRYNGKTKICTQDIRSPDGQYALNEPMARNKVQLDSVGVLNHDYKSDKPLLCDYREGNVIYH